MNFKSLILIIFFLVLILLLIQNSQAIPIIILGSSPINIPLSIIIFSGFFGGIISTLIINFFIKLSTPKTPKYSNYNPNNPNNPQPSGESQYSKKIEEKYHPYYQPKYKEDPIYPDDLDREPVPYPETTKSEKIENKEIEDINNNTPQEPIILEKNQDKEEDKTIDITPEPEIIEKPEPEIKIDPADKPEPELETNQKPRQAAPYSYQSRERTEIVPKSAKIPPRQPSRTMEGGIYDATYRVITPAYEQDQEFDDFEEDWDI
ncbi:hypothetical protein A5482_010425 [Cyanobacterium sp. IPPAS B-1200]|uniref:hypothetical protein n=1 Tax=Cyanobacterium sp. IPPAS B-1200 TaxID=1562720 RepID=UPI00085253BD|nr:hypothetical protein [Cyanobacterium sp. IPPAS B-1200]OEJ79959.1 hypothetical protein A5482_08180 [Cyanobacterium sp. IPPAS B-1200]